MALFVHGFSTCRICEATITEELEAFGLSHFGDPFDETGFWRFSGSCVHRTCLQSWAKRDEFVAYYNSSIMESPLGVGGTLVVQGDGSVEHFSVIQHKAARSVA